MKVKGDVPKELDFRAYGEDQRNYVSAVRNQHIPNYVSNRVLKCGGRERRLGFWNPFLWGDGRS